MKSAILLLSGVSTTIALLVGGLAVVQAALPNEEPRIFKDDKTPLWTTAPVRIADRENQGYHRIEARLPEDTVMVASLPPESKPDLDNESDQPGLDMMVTAALSDVENASPDEIQVGYTAEHLNWCAKKYRSYSPEDNSYISYSGERRDCQSPFDETVDEMAELQRAPWPSAGSVTYYQSTGGRSATMTADAGQVEACASRYRSYRASDNSYQPYGGGPRRPCEIGAF